ncbi:hypothetical protein GDO86_015222 [Hymenochirus boettgeri]|uniref:Secreted protein n=1 Tax=Hymenochirus boettgeri TaxID=247094 RepID=A0A8T2JUM5_9PIPI|nr:hypothetical protein GDO86_015222 [Hymenochirus boettgeri]
MLETMLSFVMGCFFLCFPCCYKQEENTTNNVSYFEKYPTSNSLGLGGFSRKYYMFKNSNISLHFSVLHFILTVPSPLRCPVVFHPYTIPGCVQVPCKGYLARFFSLLLCCFRGKFRKVNLSPSVVCIYTAQHHYFYKYVSDKPNMAK